MDRVFLNKTHQENPCLSLKHKHLGLFITIQIRLLDSGRSMYQKEKTTATLTGSHEDMMLIYKILRLPRVRRRAPESGIMSQQVNTNRHQDYDRVLLLAIKCLLSNNFQNFLAHNPKIVRKTETTVSLTLETPHIQQDLLSIGRQVEKMEACTSPSLRR